MPALRPNRRYLEVAEKIRHFIAERRLPPGAPLPNEREFAQSLAVSRSTVREAEVALEAAGHIVLCGRRRNFVVGVCPLPGNPLTMLGELEMLAARRVVEAQAAALAAHHATQDDLVNLTALMDHATRPDPAIACNAQQVFYRMLAHASSNNALAVCVDALVVSFYAKGTQMRRDENWFAAQRKLVRNGFEKVLEALTHRDPAAARARTGEHFNDLIALEIDWQEREALAELSAQNLRHRSRFLNVDVTPAGAGSPEQMQLSGPLHLYHIFVR